MGHLSGLLNRSIPFGMWLSSPVILFGSQTLVLGSGLRTNYFTDTSLDFWLCCRNVCCNFERFDAGTTMETSMQTFNRVLCGFSSGLTTIEVPSLPVPRDHKII